MLTATRRPFIGLLAVVAVFLLLTAIASARTIEASAGASIYIYLLTPGQFFANRPAYNTTCTAQSSGVVYYPGPVRLLFPLASFEDVPEDIYECTVDQPGFYRFSDIINATAATTTTRTLHLVPVSYGVTVVFNAYLPLFGSLYFPLNMTFPEGAFEFRYASLGIFGQTSDNIAEEYNYGLIGKIPARYHHAFSLGELVAASAGTYHLSVGTAYLPAIPGFPATPNHPGYPGSPELELSNFLNETGSVTIFAGRNQQTGFYGTFKPLIVDAYTWHVGSLSVTNPKEGCSRYSWHTVDTFSKKRGVDPDAPLSGTGDFLMEECFDVSSLKCLAKVYDEDVAVQTCGAFGDPHVVMFNGTGVTCGTDTAITLVDNKWFSLVGVTTLVENSPASTIRSVTFTYKSPCNLATVTFNDLGLITNSSFSNSPIASRHSIRLVGNNIYVDAIRLRIQVRAVYDASGLPTLVFGVSMPTALVAASTGVCSASCPPGTLVSIDAGTRKRDPSRIAMAEAACEDAGLTGSSFEREACLFDVETTGDSSYAEIASTSREVKADVATQWANADPSVNSAPGLATFTISAIIAALAILFVL